MISFRILFKEYVLILSEKAGIICYLLLLLVICVVMNKVDKKDENYKSIHKSSQRELKKLSYQLSSLILHHAVWRSFADKEFPFFPEVFKEPSPSTKRHLTKCHSIHVAEK